MTVPLRVPKKPRCCWMGVGTKPNVLLRHSQMKEATCRSRRNESHVKDPGEDIRCRYLSRLDTNLQPVFHNLQPAVSGLEGINKKHGRTPFGFPNPGSTPMHSTPQPAPNLRTICFTKLLLPVVLVEGPALKDGETDDA